MKKYNLNDLGEKEFSISYTVNELNDMTFRTEFENTRPFILNEVLEKLANDPEFILKINEIVKTYLLQALTDNKDEINLINRYGSEIKKGMKSIDDLFDKWVNKI